MLPGFDFAVAHLFFEDVLLSGLILYLGIKLANLNQEHSTVRSEIVEGKGKEDRSGGWGNIHC